MHGESIIMAKKIIAIGSDHIGLALKTTVINVLKTDERYKHDYEVKDVGPYDATRTHYPIYGHLCATAVATKQADLGIAICGTGIGIINSVNKTKNARGVLCASSFDAKNAVQKYNINVLGIGSKVTGEGLALEIVDTFLTTPYNKNDKSEALIKKIDHLIKNDNYQKDLFNEQEKKWEEGFYHD